MPKKIVQLIPKVAKAAKKAEKPAASVKTFKTTDGYTFYRLPDGKVVDNLDPEKVDMSWGSEKQFLKDMEGAAYEEGDELGQRRATIESYGVPTQEKLIENITQFGEDDISKFYAARKKQIEDAQRRANISAVPSPSKMDPQDFVRFAEKGMIRWAKDKEMELRDFLEGKSKFAELYLDWDDPSTYELIDSLESQGFKSTVSQRGPSNVTYLYREPEDVELILRAQNPAQYGKAYGYSDEDIARFYWERGLGPGRYAEDMATVPKPDEDKAAGGAIRKLPGLGARAAEAALKAKKTPRDEAIIAAREASKRGFLEPSKEQGRWYHGTTEDISEFKPGKRGAVFFSQDPDFASDYAPAEAIYFGKELATQPNVMPVHLQVRNPFDYENPEHVEMVMQTAKFGKSVNPQVARDNLELGNYNFIEDKNVQQAIRDLGFDSFYIKEHGLKNIGVFDPKRIKSAIGMEGRYDIEDPDITKAKGGVVDHKLQQWFSSGGSVSPEVLGGGTGLPMKKGGKAKASGEMESLPTEQELKKMSLDSFIEAYGGFPERYPGQTKPLPSDTASDYNKELQDQAVRNRIDWLLTNLPQPINPLLQSWRNAADQRARKHGPPDPDLVRALGYGDIEDPELISIPGVSNFDAEFRSGSAFAKGGAVDHKLKQWFAAQGGSTEGFQAKRASDIQAYQEGKIGADELVKYYPGLTATMIEEQLSMARGGEVKMQAGGGSRQAVQEQLSAGVPVFMSKGPEGDVARRIIAEEDEARRREEAERSAKVQALPFAEKARGAIETGQTLQSIIGRSLAAPFVALAQGEEAAKKFSEDVVLPETEAGIEYLTKTGEFLEPIGRAFERFKVPDVPFLPELGAATYIPGLGRQLAGMAKKTATAVDRAVPEAVKGLPVGMSVEPVGKTVPEVLEAAAKPSEVKAPANELGLFSGLEKAALNLERKQGSGDAFLNDLKKLATKYGVSKEEFEYSGLENYLKGKKSVTRDDVQDFAQRNRYSMSEVEYKAPRGDTSEMEFRGDVVDDPDYVDSRAREMRSEFDDYFGVERRAEIIDDIESNYTPEELADAGIRADIDAKIEERMDDWAQRRAYDEYWEDPYYRFENDLGYEVSGTEGGGFSVRDPRGNQVGDWFRDRESAEGAANQHAMEQGLISEGETQYHDYQLPQGENYRELLLQNSIAEGPRLTKKELALYEDLKNRELGFISGRISTNINDEERALLRDLKTKIDLSNKFENFTQGHWNEPDVIAHMRIQDRVTTDGKPMLYVDEMQSDWHQEGLKYGYKDKNHAARVRENYQVFAEKKNQVDRAAEAIKSRRNELVEERAAEHKLRTGLEPDYYELKKFDAQIGDDPQLSRLREDLKQKQAEFDPVRKDYEKLGRAVPDAPFKENWHELGLKRILNYAAKNGYDRIGFSSASPQIKRWGTQEIAWEKAPKIENNFESYQAYVRKQVPTVSDETIAKSWADKDDAVYKGFIRDTEKPAGWNIVATEQRGGRAGRVDLEAEARARGILKENLGQRITDKDGLRMIIDNTTRGLSEEQIDRLTNKTWERMQKFDTGLTAPREEGMRAFYDQKMKNTLQKYAERLGAKFYESETKVGRGIAESGGYQDLTEPVYIIEFTDKARNSALKGQAYKKGGLVQVDKKLRDWHREQKKAAGGVAKVTRAVSKAGEKAAERSNAIRGAIEGVSNRLAKDAEKNKSKPIASDKVIENTVNKAADRIAKENPKLSEDEVAKKAEREALAKLKWEREEKLAIEARYGELEAAKFDEPKSKRMRNIPEVVERRIEKAEEFLAQPTEPWQPPKPELQAFDRSLIREALEGFPGIEQTRFPRAEATRADLSYIDEIYGDPRNRSLIEKQIKRGLPLGGETFYASLYPIKVAALERGIPESKFNRWVYENAPASARNSILNEMAVGQFLRDMNARGLPLDEKTVAEEMAKFKEKYGIGLPLMPVHREGVRAVIEGGQDLREMVKADIPTNYKIPTYGTQKAGDFGKSMVLDVHESAGQTMGSRYHPYFTEQGGFAPLEYGPSEAKMLEIAEGLGLPGGMAQAGRWFGGGELTGLKSPRGDALDLLEKQTAYTLQGLGIKPTRKVVRNTILDMIETGEGILMPYFKSQPLPDVRTKKRGGLARASKPKGGLAALQA